MHNVEKFFGSSEHTVNHPTVRTSVRSHEVPQLVDMMLLTRPRDVNYHNTLEATVYFIERGLPDVGTR